MTGKNSVTKFAVALVLGAIAASAPFAKIAQAQGSRKDDVVFNAQGLPMAGAAVRVCTASSTGEPCSPPASIYSDNALTMPAANPLTTDGLGNYSFYAAPGRYTIEISGPGITTYQMPNVILPSDPSAPTFTTVTTTSGINAFSLSLSGNLTVTGSAAVTGSLSVGGAPVPSTGADNQWSASQRFKGPVPYRDISAYMPAGGCADDVSIDEPWHLGISINSGSASGTITGSHATFQAGCGISIFGAGPTSTLQMPAGGTATAAGSTGTVTYTLSAAHNLGIYIGLTNDNPVVVTGCANSSFDTSGAEITGVPTTTTITISSSVTGSTTGCTVSFLMAYAHGTTGATDYWYKVAAIDKLDGTSPAIGPVEVTNGNATLGRASDGLFNYNWVGWPYTPNARMFAVYRSTTSPGTSDYSLVGCATTGGWSDWGYTAPCPEFVPSTPPTVNTAESLKTTVASISGSSITLNAMASNSVTSAYSFHDETSFLLACLTDLNNDQANPSTQVGADAYCYVPPTLAGYAYFFNSDMPWDTYTLNNGAHVEVAGTMISNTWPWIFSVGGYYIHGMSANTVQRNFGIFPATEVYFGPYVPAAAVFHTSNSSGLSHLAFDGLDGFGVELSPDPSNGASGSACMDNMYISMNSSSSGVPLVFDSNTLGVNGCNVGTADNINLYPRPDGFPASILETNTTYGGNGQCCIQLGYVQFLWHHIYVESAGGLGGGQGSDLSISSALSEEDGEYATTGVVHYDSGNNDGSTNCGGPCVLPYGTVAARANGVYLNMEDADASSKVNGTISGQNAIPAWNVSVSGDVYLQGPVCLHGSALCYNSGAFGVTATPATTRGYLSLPHLDVSTPTGSDIVLYSGYTVGVTTGRFVQYLPGAVSLAAYCSTSGGSLADGTYYFKIVEEDNQASPGTTLPSPEGYCTVSGGGGHGEVTLQWQDGQFGGEKDSRVYVATQPCDIYNCYENAYTIAPWSNSSYQSYTVTSTSGWTSDSIGNHVIPSAILQNGSCVWCVVPSGNLHSGGFNFAGPGENSLPSTSTAGFKGELAVDSDSNLSAAIRGTEGTPSTTCASGVDYLWPDATDHRWKACNNNGTASDVVLKSDFASPPAIGSTAPAAITGTTVQATAVTFATLPSCASGIEGTMRGVTDSTTNTWGATITGSGSDPVLAYCDGTNWTVAGK